MVKFAAVLGSIVLVVGAAFLVVPKLLLKVSSDSKPADQSVPVGASLANGAANGAKGATPSTAAGQQPRRFEDFASLSANVGFTPLTPTSLPNGYQPFEQYGRTGVTGAPNEIVLVFRKDPDLYLFVDERPGSPPTFGAGREFGGPPPNVSRPPNSSSRNPSVDVGGSPGFYFAGRTGPAARAFGPASDLDYRDAAPHAVQFFRGKLEIVVEGDLTDLNRDQLISFAASLH